MRRWMGLLSVDSLDELPDAPFASLLLPIFLTFSPVY